MVIDILFSALDTDDEGSHPVSNLTTKLKSCHPAVYWAILSGMAALMYQVVLQKIFSYVLGGALLSTTIVVAAYMSGLALGGFLTGLFSDRLSTRANLLLYVVIETGIGVFGIASLIGYNSYLSIESRLTDWPFLVFVLSSIGLRATALLALLPMTILMGATLPILTLAVRARTGDQSTNCTGSHVTISALYSANLLGGLAGVVVSAYFVMPSLACGEPRLWHVLRISLLRCWCFDSFLQPPLQAMRSKSLRPLFTGQSRRAVKHPHSRWYAFLASSPA